LLEPLYPFGIIVKYRTLGKSDLLVSEVSLGTWGVCEGVSEDRFRDSIYTALDLGVNLIDTSNSYASGAAETFLGDVLKAIPRSTYSLATKVFFPVPPCDGGLSSKQIRINIDASLSRLRIDYVDLYQCHRFDECTPLEETMSALTEIVRQGKVRYLGFSEWSPEQIVSALQLTDLGPFISSQPQYSMLWRAPETTVFPLCVRNGIGQLVWSPLAQGILTGKYLPGREPPRGTRASNSQMNSYLMNELYSDQNLLLVQKLVAIAAREGLSMSKLALAWVLRLPGVTSAIVGASSPMQVRQNVQAAGFVLSPSLLDEIDQVLSSVPSIIQE
jgi:aryl-alcohol dehydrogenase-like predicted oxidoreductase